MKTITVTDLTNMLASGKGVTLLDVRRKQDYDSLPEGIGKAPWKDPSVVDQWMHTLPEGREVVVYCVRGGSVSQSVQKQLADNGIRARYLEGGLEAFQRESEQSAG